LDQARESDDRASRRSRVGPLDGVPIALKDLLDFKQGVPNTFGSDALRDFIPPRSSTSVDRVERAGLIAIGKTSVPEFGHKGTTDNVLIGPTSTPSCLGNNAGGSSGGSAAAVAAGMVPAALGSDGAGSIRIPASLCGIVGFKPSFGRIPSVSRPGAFRGYRLLAQGGPLARTVKDVVLLTRILAGPHPRDPNSLPAWIESEAERRIEPGVRVAYSADLGAFPVENGVKRVIEDALADLDASGTLVTRVSIDLRVSYDRLCEMVLRAVGLSIWDMLFGIETLDAQVRSSRVRDIASDEVSRLLPDLDTLGSETLRRDEISRSTIYDVITDQLEQFDYLVTPTLATSSIANAGNGPIIGPTSIEGEQVEPLLGWSLGFPFNFTGHPAVSIPAGVLQDGSPVGMQIVGRRHDDAGVLALARRVEEIRPWRDRLCVVRSRS